MSFPAMVDATTIQDLPDGEFYLIILHSTVNETDGRGSSTPAPCPKLCWTYDLDTWKQNISVLHKARVKFVALKCTRPQIQTTVKIEL